ncbi:MAG: chromosome segregation protein [Pedosphaera sp. Tous-C6FEB]|nr:MAG: chromosome segregation protein [Pedosphaera sp. Tous-C6FEB]
MKTPRFAPLGLLALAALVVASSAAAAPAPKLGVDFNRDVLPIFSENCFHCHGPDEQTREAKLRLDTKDGLLRTQKPVVVPGKAMQSELFKRLVTKNADDVMPPPKAKKTLTPAQIETVRRWIDAGAPHATHWAFTPPQRPVVPSVQYSVFSVQSKQPSTRSTKLNTGALNTEYLPPLHAFIAARLEKDGLRPSPEAPRETLIRRVTLDLTGLPPTPAEVDAFLTDKSPKAYEAVVDRLLASPRYGERMVWEWLDAARYADSNGYQGDQERTMWPWRDWAVKAFNDNLPYDQFTLWQLAGDLLPEATRDQKLATGFLRNHMINGEGGRIAEENRIEYLFDQAETVGTVWLAATMNCTRCHDHKFDAYTMRDYYGLVAFFNQTAVTGGGGSPQTAPVMDFTTPEHTARLKEFGDDLKRLGAKVDELELALFPRPAGKPAAESPAAKDLAAQPFGSLKQPAANRSAGSARELANLFRKKEPLAYAQTLDEFAKTAEARDNFNKAVPRVMVMEDMKQPRETFMLVRGAYNKPAGKTTAAFPAALSSQDPGRQTPSPTNRLDLARWLVSPENPLTARVTVNRFWQQFFGTGLVKTAEDFGVQGEKPSHPELLDWLATEFIRTGWDVKQLVRTIVTSATYRQSSKDAPVAAEVRRRTGSDTLYQLDPENRLLARGPRYRLPSWMLRDQALAASGLLVEKLGGPAVKTYQPSGIWEDATFGNKRYVQDKGDALYRRSVYVFWRRIVGPTVFFDVATRQNCSVKSPRTNTPLHALATLNDITYVEAARALAQRTLLAGGDTDAARLDHAFRLVTARKPSATEQQVLIASLTRLRAQYASDADAAQKLLTVGESKRDEKLPAAEHAAWAGLGLLLLNLDEAVTKE